MKKHNHPIDEFFRESLKDYMMEPSDGAKKAFLKDAMQLPPPVKKGRKGLPLLLAIISLVGAGIILWTITDNSYTSIADQASNSPVISKPSAGQKTSFSKTANTDNKNQPQQQFQQQQQQQLQQQQNQQRQQKQQQQQQKKQQKQQQQQQLQQLPKQQQQQQQQQTQQQLQRQNQKLQQQQQQQASATEQVKSGQVNNDQVSGNQVNGDLPIVLESSAKRSLQQVASSTQAKPQSRYTQESVQPVRDSEPTPQQTFQDNPSAAVPVAPAPAFVTPKTANGNPSIVSKAEVSNEADQKLADGTIPTNQAKGNFAIQATNNPGTQAPDSVLAVKKGDSSFKPAARKRGKTTHERINQRNWIPDIGIYYTPEWMFNTLEGTKFVNNFGIEGTFHFGRFSIRTGAGLSVGKGTNELVVEYNDFLGTYNKLDSMTFIWNDPTHNYIPTIYLSKKDVWDSLMKLDYARLVKRYTYLQVPMIMGYDFWESDRIVLGVRLGPVMSILLASKQLSEDYEPGKKQIISVNSIAPEQVSLNWQVLGGLNAAFRLTDVLNIEIEPCVRYYFNSVYEKPANNTKPWSAGVRAAFVVKF